MWIHIAIFVLVPVSALCWRQGWLPGADSMGKKGLRLYVLVALAGNLAGMALTWESQKEAEPTENVRLEKEETGSHEEKFHVFVNGEERILYVQVPQKEGEEPEDREEPEISEEEQELLELLQEIEQYNQEKGDPDYYYLPDSWEGKTLEWRKPADTSGTFLAGLCFLAALALMTLQAQEGQRNLQKRYEELLMDYPALIMKFTLLIQAGMTARRAFGKIGLDYRKRKGKKGRAAYEEILAVCNEMESGVSELEAYRRFGERCGQVKYKVFSTLLVQNLQKGSRQLSDMLEREATEAWEERKRRARVLGEAAATKLLFPMVLMLLVVMAIIMIPAFLSFYGG